MNIHGFKERFIQELRSEIPETWKFEVFSERDGKPELSVYRGAVSLATSAETISAKYTRSDYIGR